MTTRAKRVEQHRRNPAMARDSETMRRAAGTRWTPEGRVRSALRTLLDVDPAVIREVIADVESAVGDASVIGVVQRDGLTSIRVNRAG